MTLNLALLVASGFFEILGCYLFFLSIGNKMGWMGYVGGIASLIIFGILISLVDLGNASRAYAAYGGIYVLASLLWMMYVEHEKPLTTDFIGVGLCLFGTIVMFYGRLQQSSG